MLRTVNNASLYGLCLIIILVSGLVAVSSLIPLLQAQQSSVCGSDPMKDVRKPERFVVLSLCEHAEGKVTKVKKEKDGDWHIAVKLNSEYTPLLNDINVKKFHGWLVGEVEPKDQNHIAKPKGGKNGWCIAIDGPWVMDKEHGWNEIHPILNLQKAITCPGTKTVQQTQPSPAPTPTPTPTPTPPTTPSVTKKKLVVDINVKYPTITRGSTQVITVVVTSDGSKISAADVAASVTYASGKTQKSFDGTTDSSGIFTFSWQIGGNSTPGTFFVDVSVSKEGYESASASTTFEVVSKSGY